MNAASPAEPAHEQVLVTLQAVRLKGRTTAADVAAATGMDEAAAALASLARDGLVVEKSERLRLTPGGKEQLGAWLAAERRNVDAAALEPLYRQFDPHNTRLKALASAWQQRDGGSNDHSDAAYDAKVLEGLNTLHAEFGPLVDRFIELVPRLAPYADRFGRALSKIKAGDQTYFLRPLIDSYHTVWFELHEELISLLGLTRHDEAAAGRAE